MGVGLVLVAGGEDAPFVVMVVGGLPLQKGDPLGAVDLGGVGHRLQGVGHGLLQPRPAEEDAVGPLQGLHILHGEGVVVETAHRLVDHQGEGDVLRPPGDLGGEEIDGVGGGHHSQPVHFALIRPAAGQAGQQEKGGQKGTDYFFHVIPRDLRVWMSAPADRAELVYRNFFSL